MSSVAVEGAVRPLPAREIFTQASALHDLGKFAEAELLLRRGLADHPASPSLLNARGVMLAAMGDHAAAVLCYREALAHDAGLEGSWTNLGNALTKLNHVNAAIGCHRRAIALSRGDDPWLYHNLGISLAEAGQHGEAILAFTRALDLKSDCHMARWDRARAYLYLGNYRQGWADYEVRKLTGQLPARELPGREWDGQAYPAKRLVLVSEQGFGDLIWVARYLPRVKALGGELVLECRPELVRLIAGMGVADRLIARGDPLPDADLHCYPCSLPGLFTPDRASIPDRPYLLPPRDRFASFSGVFARAAGKLKVGIVWSGSVTYQNNHRRARRLAEFIRAFALPGVQLCSLQKGTPAAELETLAPRLAIIDLAPHLGDFADTAAAVAHLDLIIMTDSAVAHLAGAMGKPVWLLLGHNAHWLWLLDRNDSPWYPSVRLFRPRAEGDWDHVFDVASAELLSLTNR